MASITITPIFDDVSLELLVEVLDEYLTSDVEHKPLRNANALQLKHLIEDVLNAHNNDTPLYSVLVER